MLTPGTRLGPYEIAGALGAGGMGEVYRARDTRLERSVAIKVLPADLARSPELRQRFEREAKVVSALNHPHICALYDIGHQEGVDYLVMEYLEGETLAERMKKGALPQEQVSKIGIAVADALDRAHRQGVVHRDLKPGNVMLAKSGVKLLDFGLAKVRGGRGRDGAARGAEGGGGGEGAGAEAEGMSGLQTLTQDLTEKGTVLGTFQYMAPEQLEGKEADARTDIFALGAVLYEMATGRRAFEGKSQASLIAAILTAEPQAMTALQPLTPPALERLVRVCLAKDPEERWQSAGDVRRELRWIAEGSGAAAGATGAAAGMGGAVETAAGAHRRVHQRAGLAWGIAALGAVGMAAALAWGLLGRADRGAGGGPVMASIVLPEGTALSTDAGPVAISPDGQRLAFVAHREDGFDLLWVRPLGQRTAEPLRGTEGARFPFWSPDGRHLGFFAGFKLKKIEVSSGAVEVLCRSDGSFETGTWGGDGVILFSDGFLSSVKKVPASGGEASPVTKVDTGKQELGHVLPSFLPDGEHFVYLATSTSDKGHTLYVASLAGGEPKPIGPSDTGAVYSPSGHLLYWREGILRALRFDPDRLEPGGEAAAAALDVPFSPARYSALFSISESGAIAYPAAAAAGLFRMAWFNREGKRLGDLGPPDNYYWVRLSHDGRRVAADLSDARNNGDIWIYDIGRPGATRLTFDPANDSGPLWSPDDRQILFFSQQQGSPGDLFLKPASGAGAEEKVLASSTSKYASSWSADGRLVAYGESGDLWILSMADRKAHPFLATPAEEKFAAFAPDGSWLAYSSDESGIHEIYVQRYPEAAGKWQISSAGGTHPRWRGDGRELFFRALDGTFMSAAIDTSSGFVAGPARPLFRAPFRDISECYYDVSADGQRFLVVVPHEERPVTTINMVLNWPAVLDVR